ncbi:MAG: FAD-binding domain-containing protein, partial [Pseudomonadota bacterium]
VRLYNPIKQSKDLDPDGRFIRRWVSELAHLPTPLLHEPWKGEVEGYPTPIVDHATATNAARDRIYAVRRGRDHGAAADAIQSRHGSRRSGLPPTARRRGGPHADRRQLGLDL